jgi:hypothetical protein
MRATLSRAGQRAKTLFGWLLEQPQQAQNMTEFKKADLARQAE